MKYSIFHFNLCGFLKVIQLLKAGKAKEVSYNALASHIISEDGDNPEVGEAREVFDLPVVKVGSKFNEFCALHQVPCKQYVEVSVQLFSHSLLRCGSGWEMLLASEEPSSRRPST